MADRICSTLGCERRMIYVTRGVCKPCYARLWASERPHPGRPTARFESRIAAGSNGCWVWQGRLNRKGYGMFSVGGKDAYAHRWSYEYHVAEIPEGLVIDHLCRNPACVNPWHLDPVTTAVNTARGYWGTRTHCFYGHEFTAASTVVRPNGSRYCRPCHIARQRAKRAELREKRLPLT